MLVEFDNKVKKTDPDKLKRIPMIPNDIKQSNRIAAEAGGTEATEPVSAIAKTEVTAAANVAQKETSTMPARSNRAMTQGGKRQSLFERIKKVKNFEIYIAVALILVMVVIYMTTLGGGASSGSSGTSSWQKNNDDYAKELETKLERTLSSVKGAGKVNAMVTVVGSATIEIAYNIDEKTVTQSGSNGNATTTTTIVKTPVIISGSDGPQPIVLLEIKPQLKGVVIVASGAGDIGVRLQLLRAVQTLIADSSVQIEILTGN